MIQRSNAGLPDQSRGFGSGQAPLNRPERVRLSDEEILRQAQELSKFSSPNLSGYERQLQILLSNCSTKEQVRLVQQAHQAIGGNLSRLTNQWSAYRKRGNNLIVTHIRRFPSDGTQTTNPPRGRSRTNAEILHLENQISELTDLVTNLVRNQTVVSNPNNPIGSETPDNSGLGEGVDSI